MLRTAFWKRYVPENPPVPNAHYLRNANNGQDWYLFIKEQEAAAYQGNWFLTVNDEDIATHAYRDLSLCFPENHRIIEVESLPEDWETSFYDWTESNGFVKVGEKNTNKLEDNNAYILKYRLGNAGVALANAFQRDDKEGIVALTAYIEELKQIDLSQRRIAWPTFEWGSLVQ